MLGEVGQVEPAGPAELTDVWPGLGVALGRGHVAGVVELVSPVLPTPPALEGRRLVADTGVGLADMLLDTGSHVAGEQTAPGLAAEQPDIVLVEARLVLHQQVGGYTRFLFQNEYLLKQQSMHTGSKELVKFVVFPFYFLFFNLHYRLQYCLL